MLHRIVEIIRGAMSTSLETVIELDKEQGRDCTLEKASNAIAN